MSILNLFNKLLQRVNFSLKKLCFYPTTPFFLVSLVINPPTNTKKVKVRSIHMLSTFKILCPSPSLSLLVGAAGTLFHERQSKSGCNKPVM